MTLPQPLIHMRGGSDDPLAWPLPSSQASELKRGAIAAGPGEWRVPCSQLTFANREAWDSAVGTFVKRALEDLGVTVQTRAELSHLVLHDTTSSASFTSAVPGGAFGSLLIMLPAVHVGGLLTAAYQNETKAFCTASDASACLTSHFAMFYSACTLRCSRLTSGRRLSLVYRLSDVANRRVIRPPSQGAAARRFGTLARQWHTKLASEDGGYPLKLVYFLESEPPDAGGGLTWDGLRGSDKAIRDALIASADGAVSAYDLFLIKLKRTQSGTDGEYDDKDDFAVSGWVPPAGRTIPLLAMDRVRKLTVDDPEEWCQGEDYFDEPDDMEEEEEEDDDDDGACLLSALLRRCAIPPLQLRASRAPRQRAESDTKKPRLPLH